ncbi:MAG: hypothetical protein DI598_07170, partial [Pseudopedobacter saltans]
NQEESNYILYVTKTYDEISKSLCLQGYSLIYEIENSLRKIIAKSLYLKYGNKWFENIGYFPKIELKNVNKTQYGKIINPLEAVELDQLRIIIFEEAPLLATSRIADLLRNTNDEDIFSLKEKFIPLSNWDRIINKVFADVQKEKLQSNLLNLNSKYRRLIAHNRTFTFKEYTDLKKNYEFTNGMLKIALENLIETVQLNISEEIEIEKLENTINVKRLPRILVACKMFNIGRNTLEDILKASRKDFVVDDFYGNRKLTTEEMSILINARLPYFSNKIFFNESLEASNCSYKISENTWILNFEKVIEKFLISEQLITPSKNRIPHIIKQLSKRNKYQ